MQKTTESFLVKIGGVDDTYTTHDVEKITTLIDLNFNKPKDTLSFFLRKSPFIRVELTIVRNKDMPRNIEI